jgi:hypothetical protein
MAFRLRYNPQKDRTKVGILFDTANQHSLFIFLAKWGLMALF